MNPSITYVAGKSGGHIVPALTLASAWKKEHPDGVVTMVTTDARLDQQLVSADLMLPLGTVSRVLWKLPYVLYRLAVSFLKSVHFLRQQRPDVVISMGGLVSVPVCLAARLLRIPYELYELNVQPGAAVKFLQSGARRLHICFAETRGFFKQSVQEKIVHTPYPIRFADTDAIDKQEACQQVGLDPELPVLLILGGSQGSRSLNRALQGMYIEKHLAPGDFQVVHQTGSADEQELKLFYATHGVRAIVFAYQESMSAWYSVADMVITRAGSGALHELLFFEKRGIIIPLEASTTDHQVDNAQAIIAANLDRWTMLRQQDLREQPDLLARQLLAHAQRVQKMHRQEF